VSSHDTRPPGLDRLRILAIVTGEYGKRHVANILRHGPATWSVSDWRAPSLLPPVIDEPDEFVPDTLPPADLILSFAETAAVALLIPTVVRITRARSVIAGVDNEAWLPRGLARQLRDWLREMDVACVTPKPLCSLTETHYGVRRGEREPYQDALISEFAGRFGKPELLLSIDPSTRTITDVEVQRDSVCGNARYVAEGLVGVSADAAEQEAGLLHHHYPCLASMDVDADFGDTLMHVSGNLVRDIVAEQIRPFKTVRYVVPER
jgi:hypothetical protein